MLLEVQDSILRPAPGGVNYLETLELALKGVTGSADESVGRMLNKG